MNLARRCREIRDRIADEPIRRPPFNISQVDEARVLAGQARALHQRADVCQDGLERETLRLRACRLDQQADEVVPVEWR